MSRKFNFVITKWHLQKVDTLVHVHTCRCMWGKLGLFPHPILNKHHEPTTEFMPLAIKGVVASNALQGVVLLLFVLKSLMSDKKCVSLKIMVNNEVVRAYSMDVLFCG